jgi:hypothetical protein
MRSPATPGVMSRMRNPLSHGVESSYAVRMVQAKYPLLDAPTIAERLAYASFVSLRHRILYFETPKAACTTIKLFLRDLCDARPIAYPVGAQRESRRDMFVHIRSNVPLPSLVDLDEHTQQEVLTAADFLRFGIVRNPYTRLISAWRNKVMLCEPGYEYVYRAVMGDIPPVRAKRVLRFQQFLDYVESEPDLSSCNPHWRRQVDLLLCSAIPYSHIGKMEQLSETLSLIERHLRPAKPLRLANSNSTGGGYGPMDEAAAERIYRLYLADFEAFGYEKDSWRDITWSEVDHEVVPQARFMDEIIERNLVISYLYEQYTEMESRHRAAYRFSLARAFNVLRQVWCTVRSRSRASQH